MDIHSWENEGGRVYDDLGDDWEPSESETFTTGINPMTQLYPLEDIKYKLTCLLTEGIRHVRKYFFTRAEIAVQPTNAQQIGEFVTEIRRLVRQEYSMFVGFGQLTNTDSWANVAVPSTVNSYNWRFSFQTTQGVHYMDLPLIQIICENALKMATDKSSEEEFREINNTLTTLLREQTALDTLIYKAKDLNAQAGVVVDNLYVIAEKLQECG